MGYALSFTPFPNRVVFRSLTSRQNHTVDRLRCSTVIDNTLYHALFTQWKEYFPG